MLTTITILAVSAACIWDVRTGRIPNLLTFPAILLGFIANAVLSGTTGVENSFLGMLAGAGLLLIPFAFGGMGAGDVKMLAMVGAINGPGFVFRTFLFGAVAGGVAAVGIALWKRRLWMVLSNSLMALASLGNHIVSLRRGQPAGGSLGSMVTSGVRFPYGVAMFAGTIAAYLVRW